jgi:hypothetical protein
VCTRKRAKTIAQTPHVSLITQTPHYTPQLRSPAPSTIISHKPLTLFTWSSCPPPPQPTLPAAPPSPIPMPPSPRSPPLPTHRRTFVTHCAHSQHSRLPTPDSRLPTFHRPPQRVPIRLHPLTHVCNSPPPSHTPPVIPHTAPNTTHPHLSHPPHIEPLTCQMYKQHQRHGAARPVFGPSLDATSPGSRQFSSDFGT